MNDRQLSQRRLRRLHQYLAYLKSLPEDAGRYISAATLAEALGYGSVAVRKDLALVSDTGRPRVGHDRAQLAAAITAYLGYETANRAILVGAGNLGRALLDYEGFATYGFHIVCAVDSDPAVITRPEDRLPIRLPEELEYLCRRHGISVGIITVPAAQAQRVCDRLTAAGVRAIWNFAPVSLRVPPHVYVLQENMAASLAVLSRHLEADIREQAERPAQHKK